MMMEGFKRTEIKTSGANIVTVVGGNGPPLLLMHGNPFTHLSWHKFAPRLAEEFTVVATDLRGYGDSEKPPGGDDHSGYSFRAMAQDQVEVMAQLGFSSFHLCGHDRGGRVSHRLAVDHPGAVKKLMLLDISPTLTMYEETNMDFARSYWWWFFLIQPAPFPETMIAAAPETYLKKKIGWGHAGLAPFTDETYAAYLSHVSDPATMHGMCEDYRAAAGIDLEHDRADRAAGRRIGCDVRVLWGEFGVVNRCFKPVDDWRAVTQDAYTVTGRTVPCGHYIPEEVPQELMGEMQRFFA